MQQKSVHRKSGTLTAGLTVFSRNRCIASETRRSRDIQQKTVRQKLDACVDGHRAAVQEKKRWDTRGLTANNDHSGGVEGLSRPRHGRVPKTEEDAAHVAACETLSTWSTAVLDRLSLLQFDSVFSCQRQPSQTMVDQRDGLACMRGLVT